MAAFSTSGRRLQFALAICLQAVATLAAAQLPDFSKFSGGAKRGEEVTVEAEFTAATADRPALLFVTARIPKGFHVSATDQGTLPEGGGPQATVITLKENPTVRLAGAFQPIQPPEVHLDTTVWKGLELREHFNEVTWFAPIVIAEGADAKSLAIEGMLEGQACDNVCIPLEIEFTAEAGEGMPLPAGANLAVEAPAAAVTPEGPATSNDPAAGASAIAAAELAPPANNGAEYDLSKIQLRETKDESLLYYLLTAFLGGIILNVMPCVLPVIGLKVMSFVQQAGESRARALTLNLWYSAGIVTVFLALAALAVTLQVGWGDQFGNAPFLITLTAIVFAMALSLLGLWEIPIPGFVGSGAALKAAEREGAPAAFLKGVLTTVLATPCTGPYMVAGTTWAIKQPPHVTFSVFAALGLGMASPYLLVGAFPALVRFLPRPGMWMETFKKAMGLVLLATVVWLLSTLDSPLVVPTFALMVGITAACWWIAQTPVYEAAGKKAYAWATALMFTAIVATVSYGWLYKQVMLPRFEKRLSDFASRQVAESQMEIAKDLSGLGTGAELERFVDQLVADVAYEGDKPWQSFSLAKLGRLVLEERRTVLVDFTADWCATCKTFEQTILKTAEVEQALADAKVVTMVADYTRKPEWLRKTIRALDGIGVPVIAVFPADRPYAPIVFHGGYTKAGILDAVAQATGVNLAAKTAAVPSPANR